MTALAMSVSSVSESAVRRLTSSSAPPEELIGLLPEGGLLDPVRGGPDRGSTLQDAVLQQLASGVQRFCKLGQLLPVGDVIYRILSPQRNPMKGRAARFEWPFGPFRDRFRSLSSVL
jgi:hypothetical protein